MRQLTLRFQAQDTWFFQELRPGNSGWLASQFPPPARVFEGAIRTLLAQACGQPDVLAGNLRMAGPWPCLLEAAYFWHLELETRMKKPV